LGHVAVCIEDLQALLDLLQDRPDVTGDVVVEFDEGYFTEGRDLRELGDASLRELRVTAGELIVHLSSRRAEAIGPAPLVDFVDNAWARARQTSKYPSSWGRHQQFAHRTGAVTFSLFGAVILVIIPFLSKPVPLAQLVLSEAAMAACFAALALLVYWSNRRAYERVTFAVVQPLTAHELREAESKNTTVPLWSLIVTAIGLVISTTFLILNYVR
jgi:hypothetical protein